MISSTKFNNSLTELIEKQLKSITNHQTSHHEQFLQFIQENWNKFECDKISLSDFNIGIAELVRDKHMVIILNKNKDTLYVKKSFNYEDGGLLVPLIYDLLMQLFKDTTSKERETYFHLILQDYYSKMSVGLLQTTGQNLSEVLPDIRFKKDVRKFLPFVKLDTLKHAAQENNIFTATQMVQEVYECITYSKLLREDCYSIVSKISTDIPYEFEDFKLSPILDSSGTLGEYYNLNLSVSYKKTIKTVNLFVKCLPTNTVSTKDQRELAINSVKKEEFFYDTFISNLNKLGFSDITNFVPNLYLVVKDEALMFEDLSEMGYQMSDIRKPATVEWLTSCMINLAKLHACSILFEEKMSVLKGQPYRIHEEYGDYLIETLIIKDNRYYGNSGKTVYNGIIQKFPDIPKLFSVEEFQRRAKLKFDLECEMVKKSTKYRNVVCHGDTWAGNILFKKDSETATISSFLVDFQLIKYCPPTFDVLQNIYTNTSREIRGKKLDYLLRVYYKNLTNNLSSYGVDINRIFDENTFKNCCKDMRSTAICSALNLVQLCVPENRYTYMQSRDEKKRNEFLVGDRIKFLEEPLQKEPFRTRIRDLLVDLYHECLDEDE